MIGNETPGKQLAFLDMRDFRFPFPTAGKYASECLLRQRSSQENSDE
jgi:hypothetical protein